MNEYRQNRARLAELNSDIERINIALERLMDARIESRAHQEEAQKKIASAQEYLDEQRQMQVTHRVDAYLGWDVVSQPEIARAERDIEQAQQQARESEAYRNELVRRHDELRANLSALEWQRNNTIVALIEVSPAHAKMLEEIKDVEARFLRAIGTIRDLTSQGVKQGIPTHEKRQFRSLVVQILEQDPGTDGSVSMKPGNIPQSEWRGIKDALIADHNAPLPGEAPPKRGFLQSMR